MNDPVINTLNSLLRELEHSFVEQPADDYPSYRQRVGEYNGVKKALAAIESLYSEDE